MGRKVEAQIILESRCQVQLCSDCSDLLNSLAVSKLKELYVVSSQKELLELLRYNMLTAWCIPCPDHIIVEHDQVAPQGPTLGQTWLQDTY